MLIVNLYGAPGAGKSTGAAYIFSKLKMAGVNAELITEFAKDKVWEDSTIAFKNHVYIFGEQYFRLTRVQDKVDVVVTDSPLLLSIFYNTDQNIANEFDQLVTKINTTYSNSINFFIDRDKPYNPVGRLHTRDESDKLAADLKQFLKLHNV